MTRLEIPRALRAAMADPARVHDVAVLQGALTGSRASTSVEAGLDAVRAELGIPLPGPLPPPLRLAA